MYVLIEKRINAVLSFEHEANDQHLRLGCQNEKFDLRTWISAFTSLRLIPDRFELIDWVGNLHIVWLIKLLA